MQELFTQCALVAWFKKRGTESQKKGRRVWKLFRPPAKPRSLFFIELCGVIAELFLPTIHYCTASGISKKGRRNPLTRTRAKIGSWNLDWKGGRHSHFLTEKRKLKRGQNAALLPGEKVHQQLGRRRQVGRGCVQQQQEQQQRGRRGPRPQQRAHVHRG